MKKIFSVLISLLILSSIMATSISASTGTDFIDVPKTNWAYGYINTLRSLGITDGIGNNKFGLGLTVTRAEFAAFLCKLMKWNIVQSQTATKWYIPYVQTALQNGADTCTLANFRPEAKITREEIAVMLIRTLGYDNLGSQLSSLGAPFPDVHNNPGYIRIAKDFGIVTGISAAQFAPGMTATREQAAAMMIRMYNLQNNKISFMNGFYAISSSKQMSSINNMDSVSFGWSRLEPAGTGVTLNTTNANSNEYNIPQGYQTPFDTAAGKTKMLMVAVKDIDSANIINNDALRASAVTTIANAINNGIAQGGTTLTFDGVVADFETLKGTQSEDNYDKFLTALKTALSSGKKLYVTVHPQLSGGRAYYDGYDYKTIGQLADKVILMAHDYNPKSLTASDMANGIVMTPCAPIADVYYALEAITNPTTGVQDKSKIVLQISFSTVQWKTVNGKVINSAPYTPNYDSLVSQIHSGAQVNYSDKYQSPYLTFTNTNDQSNNIIWYEDDRSVSAKMKLAELFGINGISLWRIGTIPDYRADIHLDVLQTIQSCISLTR